MPPYRQDYRQALTISYNRESNLFSDFSCGLLSSTTHHKRPESNRALARHYSPIAGSRDIRGSGFGPVGIHLA